MGWTFSHRPKGVSDTEFFGRLFPHLVMEDLARGREGVVWIRLRNPEGGGLFVLAVFTSRHPKEHLNFGYKIVDEAAGPYAFDCPLRMLEGLPEPRNHYARDWREKVRNYHEQQAKEVKAKPKVGDLIRFDVPVKFRGFSADLFVKVQIEKRKSVFRVVGGSHDGLFVRLPHRVLQQGVVEKKS